MNNKTKSNGEREPFYRFLLFFSLSSPARQFRKGTTFKWWCVAFNVAAGSNLKLIFENGYVRKRETEKELAIQWNEMIGSD